MRSRVSWQRFRYPGARFTPARRRIPAARAAARIRPHPPTLAFWRIAAAAPCFRAAFDDFSLRADVTALPQGLLFRTEITEVELLVRSEHVVPQAVGNDRRAIGTWLRFESYKQPPPSPSTTRRSSPSVAATRGRSAMEGGDERGGEVRVPTLRIDAPLAHFLFTICTRSKSRPTLASLDQ